jgi:hypothetical protein
VVATEFPYRPVVNLQFWFADVAYVPQSDWDAMPPMNTRYTLPLSSSKFCHPPTPQPKSTANGSSQCPPALRNSGSWTRTIGLSKSPINEELTSTSVGAQFPSPYSAGPALPWMQSFHNNSAPDLPSVTPSRNSPATTSTALPA